MIFVINNLKYDTDKMELISKKCRYTYYSGFFGRVISYKAKDVKLWRSKKNNWLMTYETGDADKCGISLTIDKVKTLLLKYDVDNYEKIFGELEEA